MEEQRKIKYVVVSCDSRDEVQAKKLRDLMSDKGVSVWWRGDIKAGQDKIHEYRKAVRGACAVVFCFSGSVSNRESSSLYLELDIAIKINKKMRPGSSFIVPVMLEPDCLPDLDVGRGQCLKDLKAVELFNGWDIAVKELFDSLVLLMKGCGGSNELNPLLIEERGCERNEVDIFFLFEQDDYGWFETFRSSLRELGVNVERDVWGTGTLGKPDVLDDRLLGRLYSSRIVVVIVSLSMLRNRLCTEEVFGILARLLATEEIPVFRVHIEATNYEWSFVKEFIPLNDPKKPLGALKSASLAKSVKNISRKILDSSINTKWGEIKRWPLYNSQSKVRMTSSIAPYMSSRYHNYGPKSVYMNKKKRELAKKIESAYKERFHLESRNLDSSSVKHEIKVLTREFRDGQQLEPYEFLCDGAYKLIKVLGEGGFATVWLARDMRSGDYVALKILHNRYIDEGSRKSRFYKGAEQMKKLSHRQIVKVFEPNLFWDSYFLFVMEFVQGEDFEKCILNKNLKSIGDKVNVICEVGKALSFAHEKTIIHRDIKPSNILCSSDGIVKLTDFDLVLTSAATTSFGTTGIIGTLLYSSPGVVSGKEATFVDDIYSLTMTTIFAVYGEPLPFSIIGNSVEFVEDLPCNDSIKGVLIKGLMVDPGDLFGSVRDFCESLAFALKKPDKSPYKDIRRFIAETPRFLRKKRDELEERIRLLTSQMSKNTKEIEQLEYKNLNLKHREHDYEVKRQALIEKNNYLSQQLAGLMSPRPVIFSNKKHSDGNAALVYFCCTVLVVGVVLFYLIGW